MPDSYRGRYRGRDPEVCRTVAVIAAQSGYVDEILELFEALIDEVEEAEHVKNLVYGRKMLRSARRDD